jgi:hypothetical protein
MSFVYAKTIMATVLQRKFIVHGEWEHLHKSIHELAEVRADRALLEMAAQLRVLDDQQELNDYFRQTGEPSWRRRARRGKLARTFLSETPQTKSCMWDLDPEVPRVICFSKPKDEKRWHHAEIERLCERTNRGSSAKYWAARDATAISRSE